MRRQSGLDRRHAAYQGRGYFINDKEPAQAAGGDVQTCFHCQAVLLMQQWKVNGAWCGKCMKPICDACRETALRCLGCEPFLKKIEQYAEAQMRFREVLSGWRGWNRAHRTLLTAGR